jgi:hypothetical protein
VVEFGFSWLARKVMIEFLGKVSGKLLSRWRLLGGDNTYLSVTIRFNCPQTWLSLLEVSQAFGFPYP